jgi:hypothetical protein
MVAGMDTLHGLTDLLHHSRSLMTEHHWSIGLVPVVTEVYIGMTDARCDKAYQDFVFSRAFHLKGFNPQRASLLPKNGRLNYLHLHVRLLFLTRSLSLEESVDQVLVMQLR